MAISYRRSHFLSLSLRESFFLSVYLSFPFLSPPPLPSFSARTRTSRTDLGEIPRRTRDREFSVEIISAELANVSSFSVSTPRQKEASLS